MACPLSIVSAVVALVWNSLRLLADIFTFFRLCLRSPAAVAAENLFLRKQLSLYIERKTKPRRATDPLRFTLARLSRFFDWRNTLTIVKPDTLIRLASQRIPPVLEAEISASRPATHSARPADADRRNGREQANLGRGTYRP